MQQQLARQVHEKRNNHRLRKHWYRIVSALIALVVFCTTYALILPAITMSRQRICGQEEHTHDAACYEEQTVLVCEREETPGHTHTETCYEEVPVLHCSLEEDETHSHEEACWGTETVLTCGLEEQEPHLHGEDCYETQTVLTCTLPAHTHTEFCYSPGPSDPNADTESEADWLRSFAGAVRGEDPGADAAAIAKTQLGYRESSRNYTENGTGLNGYTRYGAWYGKPYGDWDAMFASFVLHYAGIDRLGRAEDSAAWAEALKAQDAYRAITDGQPETGDLLFLDTDTDGRPDHVGILTASDETVWHAIEGDVEDAVSEAVYVIGDVRILGYGPVTQPEAAALSRPEEDAEADTRTDLLLADGKVLLCGIPEGFVAEAIPVSVEIEGETVLAAYDITIYASEADREAGIVWQPGEGETVNVRFIDEAFENLDSVSVYHMETPEAEPELVEELTPEGGEISFEAEGFSVYVAATGSSLDTGKTYYLAASAGATSFSYTLEYENSAWRIKNSSGQYLQYNYSVSWAAAAASSAGITPGTVSAGQVKLTTTLNYRNYTLSLSGSSWQAQQNGSQTVYIYEEDSPGSPDPGGGGSGTGGGSGSTGTIELSKQIEWTGTNADDYSFRLHLTLDGSTLSEGSVTTVTPGNRRGIGIILDVTETMLSTWSGASDGSNKFDAVRALLQGSDGFLSKILDGNTDVYIIVVGGQTGTATYLQLSDLVASGSSLGDFSNINNSLHVSQGISYVTGLKAAEYYMGNNIDSLVYIIGNETDTYVSYANGNVERGTTGTQAQTKNYNDYLTFMANHPSLSMYMLGVAPVERGSSIAQQMGAYSVNRGTGGGYYEAGNTGALEQQLTNIAEQIVVPPDKTSGISVTDTLSSSVSMAADPDLTATLVLLNADGTVKSSSDVSGDATLSGGTVNYNRAAEIEGPFRLEIAFNVRTADGVYKAAGGYPNTGDADTDYGLNTTSSGQPGYYSNETAIANYTLNGAASGDRAFPKPVVQAPEKATVNVSKQWVDTPAGEQTPVTVELRRGSAGGTVIGTLTLEAPDWTGSADLPILTAVGADNTVFFVETAPASGFSVSYSAASVTAAANGSYSVTVTNAKQAVTRTAALTVQKTWHSVQGSETAVIHVCTYDGTTYTDVAGSPFTVTNPSAGSQSFTVTWTGDTPPTLWIFEEHSDRFYPVTGGDGSEATVVYGGYQPAARTLTPAADGTYTVTLENMAVARMPETGDPGTRSYVFGGLALMLGAALLLIRTHKRETERRADGPSPG